jgi:hypothetical protein
VYGFVEYCVCSRSIPFEEFEDTKGAIRIRISKKNRQHNGQKKKCKKTNNDLQNIHVELKIEYHEDFARNLCCQIQADDNS